MYRYRKNWALYLLGCILSFHSFKIMAATHAQEFVGLVEKVRSYQAEFVQLISDEQGEVISRMSGQMKVLRPGKFYWKSNAPDPILVVADGRFLWTYDIELEQVTKQDLGQALSTSPAAVLMGSGHQLLEDFKVTQSDSEICGKPARQCYLLKPTAETEMFQNIEIIFDKEILTEVNMVDPLGQYVHTKFSKIRINEEISNQTFAFSPPSGVDVIKPVH